MKNLSPFKIEVEQTVLDDLQYRLQHTRWTDEPEGADWSYGTNGAYLKQLLTYWQNDYDWRKHESALNVLPHFKAEIDGINIHFIHVKGKGKNPKPLLLTHGWPDSFYRFYKAIPLLSDPESAGGNSDQSFDLVIPSLPGFGFSDRVALNTDKVAALWAKLMTEVLGYDRYYAAGGDIGAIVTKSLANQQPGQVIAIHLTDVGYPNGQEDWSTMSAAEQEFGQFIQHWWYSEGAYNMIQSTKPQTLGYGLNDSPAGLAAWIIEKFNSWSDTNGDIENSFTKDELITNIMIYWVSQSINTSIRTYLENARAAWSGQPSPSAGYVQTPTGVSLFPAEAPAPIEWAQRMVNVKRFNKMEKGGHFAALEVPDAWANELRSFFYNL
ncbi:epoxide hydrolase family protein [Pedobacter zeae]|uniref:Multidrug MFS transporter n=1 Tax=Pedobacter zeae TaxID=1737356 RepID=A0A7W6KB67_9SPHI|nr:epoxide hydrolase family protein [Pedobacter zeae]MBB4108432.1 pimeloyl-ACP methyl ester carboxylesterase [Pedobacter zeae]GGG92850.1 multidrug MFS transporter [Pedobacter zeae]